jgi:hypothetical protein
MNARRIQHQASVLWSSFMVAAVAELLVFGLIDPIDLLQFDDGLQMSRTQIYSFGFLFFWAVGIISSELSALLHHPVQQSSMTASDHTKAGSGVNAVLNA